MTERDPAQEPLLRAVRATDREVLAALRTASRDAKKHLTLLSQVDTADASFRRNQIRAHIRAINLEISRLWSDVSTITVKRRQDAAERAAKSWLAYERDSFPSSAEFSAAVGAMAREARDNIDRLRSTLSTSRPELSKRIYRADARSTKRLERLLNGAIARGLSPRELAKEVEKYIRPSIPGGVSYAARRLAQTEISIAYHAQQVEEAKRRPWVIGVKWNTSPLHTHKDRCDFYATFVHSKGKDPGQFEPGRVPPIPHPFCLCYLTPILADSAVLNLELGTGRVGRFLESWRVS